jgi:membrane protease YdiL (CAAX protease family)
MLTRRFQLSDVAFAFALLFATELAIDVIRYVVATVGGSFAILIHSYRSTGSLSLWIVAMMSMVNPIFEEMLYLGYAANVLRQRFGFQTTLWCVVVLRMLVHVYQGPLALVTILPISIIFSWYYLRTNRLWPLIIVHAMYNLLSLGSIALR